MSALVRSPDVMFFFLIGILIDTYLYYVEQISAAIFPLLLLIAGAVGILFTQKATITEREPTTLVTYILYFALAVVVIALAGLSIREAIPSSLLSTANALSLTGRGLIAVLMAISEEFFFRGFLAGYLYVRQGMIPATIVSAAIFTLYHLAVYGTSTTLLYVFISGIVLAFVFLRTGSLVPDLSAHILNNLIATGILSFG